MSDDPTRAEELLREVGRDPGRTRALRKALERLAGGGAGEELQEMAREVLAGRVDFRQAMTAGPYQDAIGARVDRFVRWYDEQSPEELREHLAQAEAYLAAQRREVAEER